MPDLTGLRSVKLPVADVAASLEWYRRVFAVEPYLEFPDDHGVVVGVACHLPGTGGTGIALRQGADAGAAPGFEIMLGVADHDALAAWGEHLDALRVRRSPLIDATVGWLIVLHDPDGHEIHLYTDARHGIDQGARPGYGRAPAAGNPEAARSAAASCAR